MNLFEVIRNKFKPFDECEIGDKVYSRVKIEGVKPYSILTVTGFSFSKEGMAYILSDGDNVYYLRDIDDLCRYKGQDLKKQRIRDIIVLAVELAVMLAVTGALQYCRALILS